MSPLTRIIGIGSAAAGDDAAGLEVVRAIERNALPARVEVYQSADPAALIELVSGCARAIIVDAVVGGEAPGKLVELAIDALQDRRIGPLSTHSLTLGQALTLCRALHPVEMASDIRIVGITIAVPRPEQTGMSPEVKAAVPSAAAHIVALVQSLQLNEHRARDPAEY